jgi:uncharacterized protein (TIGR02301 family)
LVAALPAAAQTRARLVSDMAFSLGQSHALRQLCQGPNDQYWRKRMEKMIQLETIAPAERAPLAERFNDGFRAARGQYPRCTQQSRAAERSTADHGRATAGLLARAPASL